MKNLSDKLKHPIIEEIRDSKFNDETMKTLDLVLKGKWYDMIASGEKTEEYRAIKPYWEKRLLDYEAIKRDYEMLVFRRFLVGKGVDPLAYPRGFTHVRFHRGYTKITMTFEIDSITFGNGKEEWGAEPGKKYFVIKLKRRSE